MKFTTKWGYEFLHEETVESELLGRQLLLVYRSVQADRAMKIYLSEKFNGRPARLSVVIENLHGGHVLLEDYLREHANIEYIKRYINLNDGLSETDFIKSATKALSEHCDGILNNIISGKEWDVKEYDWSPYR